MTDCFTISRAQFLETAVESECYSALHTFNSMKDEDAAEKMNFGSINLRCYYCRGKDHLTFNCVDYIANRIRGNLF